MLSMELKSNKEYLGYLKSDIRNYERNALKMQC